MSDVAGIPVVESPHLPYGKALLVNTGDPGAPVWQYIVSTRPPSEVEYAGRVARWQVRHGMREVLAWLGEDVGPYPTRDAVRITAQWSLGTNTPAIR